MRSSKSPARATCPYYRGLEVYALRDARRVAVPKTTRAGIAAWRICRYNLDTVPDAGHANKAVEAGVQTSCPFQYKDPHTAGYRTSGEIRNTVPVAPPGGTHITNSSFLRFFIRSVPLFRSLMLTPMLCIYIRPYFTEHVNCQLKP